LGIGSLVERTSPNIVLFAPGIIVGNIIQISAGLYHSLGLHENGMIYCFGYGGVNFLIIKKYGQLGLGDGFYRYYANLIPAASASNIIKISTGAFHSLLINNIGKVYAFGKNDV
jgi:alpha-tubulin suppressor-like RCC1 family protein